MQLTIYSSVVKKLKKYQLTTFKLHLMKTLDSYNANENQLLF